MAFRSESFANRAVRVPAKPGFLARQILELAANGLRAMSLRFSLRRRLLQSLALVVLLLANAFNSGVAESDAVRVGGDVLNAEVYKRWS